MLGTPELLVRCGAEVGEGPVYNASTNEVLWLDLPRGMIWRTDLSTGVVAHREVGEPVGSLAFTADNGLIVAAQRGILHLASWVSHPRLWLPFEPDLPTRFNDGKCDDQGRFIVGKSGQGTPPNGSFWRIEGDGAREQIISAVGMPNGLGWSPDRTCFFQVDSTARVVNRYRWDLDVGAPYDRRRVVVLSDQDGLPDGLTVDCEGFLWVAVWGTGEIRRYDPDGELVGVVRVPTPNVTSCVFAGPNLDTLFITTAAQGAPPASKSKGLAGSLYVMDTRYQGLAEPNLFLLQN